jgi:DNA-binding Xre family transcriptional regulator
MAMRNRIRQIVDGRGITPYEFWKRTGIGSQTTAYALYNNPEQYPGKNVMNAICETFRLQPGEVIEWVPDAMSRKTSK